jgi:arylsulfatase A-like enzyme
MRRVPTLLLPAILLASALAACGTQASRPDVLLVVIDTLRADRTTVLEAGLPTTPRLAALGDTGIVYSQAVAPSSWTVPSMASLFSGREVTANRYGAFADAPSLAERFSAGGYTTLAVVANPLVSREGGFDRGFDTMEIALEDSWTGEGGEAGGARPDQNAVGLELVAAWSAEAMVARARAALEAADPERPVFLYLHLMDVHAPRDPAHFERVPALPGWSAGAEGERFPRVSWTERLTKDQGRTLSRLRRLYDGQIAYVDEVLGPLLEEWRARGGVVAVTADHGEGMFTRARDPDSEPSAGVLASAEADHGYQRTEEALRVPLWLTGPGVAPGRREARPVALRDTADTLLHLAGLPASSSRLPLTESDPVPDVIFGTDRRGWFARNANRKLLLPFPDRLDDERIRPRLVEVSGQHFTAELEDLSAAEPEAFAALVEALQRWRDAHPDDQPSDEDIDAVTLERLRALGYLK